MNFDDADRKRAYYRACHRGTKEMDWMLGRYAEAELSTMSDVILIDFERLLALPDPQIEAMLKGADCADVGISDLIARIKKFHGLN